MEPKQQVEIQLGHMCNNRCVFCVSGQQTALGRARPLPLDPILERLTDAYAQGNRKLTILGGEPTLQPGFKDVLRHAVKLGFEEIVIFTNGVKTARPAFVDEVLEIGGDKLTWRISIQGANKAAHERTTKKPGSFDRIVKSLENLQARDQRVTVNMCVVGSNYDSVADFPALVKKYGVRQLHLDMVRPLDAGERSEDEFKSMLEPYAGFADYMREMAAGFDEGFDLNIGNLPFCVVPELADRIHHDGETTFTIAVDGDNDLSRPWNKYFVKKRDKLKKPSCAECTFEPRCSGVYEKYIELNGDAEFVPLSAERLRKVDPERRVLWAHFTPLLRRVEKSELPSGFDSVATRLTGDYEGRVVLLSQQGELELALRPPGLGIASTDLFSLQLLRAPRDRALTRRGIDAIWRLLSAGSRTLHPPADDMFEGAVAPSIATRLGKLRATAPFGELCWTSIRIENSGRRATVELTDPEGHSASLWLGDDGGKSKGGYHVDEPSDAIVTGLRAMMAALKPASRSSATATA